VITKLKRSLFVRVATVLMLAGCGGASTDKQFEGVPLERQDPGPTHVHGLGLDQRTGTLFIATHTGLFEVPRGAPKARRVGDRFQDTMGFTAVSPDLFLGSGHPDIREDAPPLLGLIKSADQGRSWKPVSLRGKADFHILRSRGQNIYGYDSSHERLMTSTDGGEGWTENDVPEAFLDLVVDPADASHLLASGAATLYESRDRGKTWRTSGVVTGLLGWPSPQLIYLIEQRGRVQVARGTSARWRPLGDIGGEAAALLAVSERDLYVALHDGTIKRSTDGGRNWDVRSKP